MKAEQFIVVTEHRLEEILAENADQPDGSAQTK